MKVGDTRYTASIWDGRIEYDEWVLRSIQRRKRYAGMRWIEPPLVFYWVNKIKGVTWVKRSKSHGDWGFAKSIPPEFRRAHLESNKPIGRPSKLGALKALRAEVNGLLKTYGAGIDPEFPDDEPYDVQLTKIDRAITRAKKSK